MGPAYRIVTERLCLRCYEPSDAPALKAAIDASLGSLVPWLPWAREEPRSLESKVELLRHFRGRFDLGKDYVYGVFAHDEAEVVGGAGLHRRAAQDARELGYWIARAHAGRGLATEAAAALVRVAFEVDRVERVEIRCDEANERSSAIARKLGFRHDGTLRARSGRGDGTLGGQMVFSLFADEFEESASARAHCEAFDAIGRRILELPAARVPGRRSAFR